MVRLMGHEIQYFSYSNKCKALRSQSF